MITLTIPELTPSLNKTQRQHWTILARNRKRWSMLVLVAKSEAEIWKLPLIRRARVTIERHGGKQLDEDNLAGGAKAAVDALKSNGLIVDDSPDHVQLRYEQYPGGKGKEKKTVVRIEPL